MSENNNNNENNNNDNEEKIKMLKMTKKRIVPEVPYPAVGPLPSDKLFIGNEEDFNINLEVLKDWLFNEGRLSFKDMNLIIEKATSIFCKEDTLLQVQSPITICGDVHGQYYDLMKLLEVGGDPEKTNYLFLGDYVDRGNFSVECVILLYAYKISYPDTFFMIRGNHECRHLTEYFTFKLECKTKYSEEIYDSIMESFDSLPLAAVMNGQFLCVHGGISPEIEGLETIANIDRFMEPPPSGPMCDLMWADPLEDYGEDDITTYTFNEARGCSYSYGFKAVCEFLDRNNLTCIIRAHEAQDLGYKMYRRNPRNQFPTLITLFSAPNYLDMYGNKGAVMRYGKNVMNIRQFQHNEHPYYLPNFMDVLTWSAPFVAEKVADILLAILKAVDTEEEITLEQIEAEKAARRNRLKQKILLVGKLAKMYSTLVTERESILQLKGLGDGKIPQGLLIEGRDAIHECIGNFQKAKEADKRNEKRPSGGPPNRLLKRQNSSSAALRAAIFQRQNSEPTKLNINVVNKGDIPSIAEPEIIDE